MLAELSEADLLSRMRNFEDHFVERKTTSDINDAVKTVVAFANTAPIGYPCVLYIGVRDNGEIEVPQKNLDNAQKTFNQLMRKIYPRAVYLPKILNDNGQQVLAVIVPGSEMRPHFSGPAYVRNGSESIPASEQMFEELIASRNSKVNRILQYKGKTVSVVNRVQLPHGVDETHWNWDVKIFDCDQFYVTLISGEPQLKQSFPLSRVNINFDHGGDRLLLELRRES